MRSAAENRLLIENELPPLPDGWSVERFRFLFSESKERNGATPIGDMLSVSEYRGVVPREYEHEEHRRTDQELENYRVVRPGQLAVNTMWLNHLGLGISDHLGHVSPAYAVYQPSKRLDGRFVHHLLRSQFYLKIYLRYLYGIRPNSFQIKSDDWKSIPVILPDLPTQKAIAAFLDRETARIDQLIDKKQRLVELLGEKANSAVELELANVQGKRTKLRWIARLKGGAGFPVEAQGSSEGDLAFFKVKHLGRANADGTLTEADDYIDAVTAQKLRAAVFPKGSIVLAKIGAALMLSRFRVLGVDACIDNNMAALLVKKRKVDPRFLLLSLSRFDMSVYANPGAVPSLNGDAFMNEHLVLPTRDVQAEIVALSEAASARIARTEGRVGLSIDRLKEYRSAIITAAVTGQIDLATWSRRGEGDWRLDQIEEEMAG